MGNYEQLKQAVSNVIKNNGNMEITGDILQNTLLSIISTVGGNATFAGIATPSTNPGAPDGPVFYIATQVGIYSNFGGIEVANEEAAILQWYNGSWVKVISGLATTEISDSVERYGYGINGSGLVVKDVDFILSPFITIPDGCETLEWGTGGALNASDFTIRPVYLCLYNENKDLIPTQAWFPNGDIRQIPLAAGTKYVRFPVYRKNVANAYVKNDEYGVYYDFNGYAKITKEAARAEAAETEISDSVERYGYGINGSGLVVKDVDFILSPFITIPDGCETLEWGTGGALNASDFTIRPVYLCLYNENKDLIPTQAWFPNGDIRQIPLAAGTKYVRFPVLNKNIGGAYIENDEFNLFWSFSYNKKLNTKLSDLSKEVQNTDDTLYALENLNKTKIDEKTGNSDTSYKPLVLLYFADIHNDDSNLKRIVDFSAKYNSYLNDVFLNGDIAGGNWNQFSEEFNEILANNKILCSIGNHDIYNYNNTLENATAKQCYDRYFSNIAQWGVTEPSNNTTIGKCYYYKDYTSSGIRFIVLDCMHYDTAQNDWLKSVLTSAITSKLSVVIAQHIAIKGPTSNDVEAYNVPFNSIDHQDAEASNGGQFEAVKDFIANGGEFVTWLFGHSHSDFCGKIKDTMQNYIIVGAAIFNANWNDTVRNSDDYSIDLFNVISVDTKSKTISIKRVGANYDRFLRRRNAMCINYKECSVISFN